MHPEETPNLLPRTGGQGAGKNSCREPRAARATEPIGRYTYDVVHDVWNCSEAVSAMHGYRPGEMGSDIEAVLRHKHPDDRARVDSCLARTLATGEPFSVYHRIVDSRGKVRHVVVLGEGSVDERGQVGSVDGYFVDLTEARAADLRDEVQHHLDAALSGRAVIEQAKGVLMLVYGIDPELAWRLLRWQSQEHNIRLRELARHLIARVAEQGGVCDRCNLRLSGLFLNPSGRGEQRERQA